MITTRSPGRVPGSASRGLVVPISFLKLADHTITLPKPSPPQRAAWPDGPADRGWCDERQDRRGDSVVAVGAAPFGHDRCHRGVAAAAHPKEVEAFCGGKAHPKLPSLILSQTLQGGGLPR